MVKVVIQLLKLIEEPRRSSVAICVVMSGHLATCPRMLKVADALWAAGYKVRVISAWSTNWGKAGDEDVLRTRTWPSSVVDYHRQTGWATYIWSGARFHAARRAARSWRSKMLPLWLAARAYGRVHPELTQAIGADPCGLVYGGTAGALAAAAVAARRGGVPYALDLEDFHTGELEDRPANRFVHEWIERIEHDILPGASFLTTATEAVKDAYAQKYGVPSIPIHNTFPLPSPPPVISVSECNDLKLYWFSQTIGHGRGLEDAVRAMGLAGVPGQLHLRGRGETAYVESLRQLARTLAPRLALEVHPPAPPDEMITLCRDYDAGLAMEFGFSRNRLMCATNKVFTYMLAGLALVMTNIPGQRPIIDELGPNAIVYEPGDVATLAAGLKAWATDRMKLRQAKIAAWQAAERRWHWEHALERGALLDAVASVIGPPAPAFWDRGCSAGTTGPIG